MKIVMLPLLVALAGRATPFEYSQLGLGSLPEHATKAQLVKRFGQPAKASRARYECGSRYVDAPGHTYYLLQYPQATYIGNATEGHALEKVHFVPGGVTIRYGRFAWNANTTLAAVRKLFGADALLEEKLLPGAVVLSIAVRIAHTNTLADSRVDLIFRQGRLVKYTTWEPC